MEMGTNVYTFSWSDIFGRLFKKKKCLECGEKLQIKKNKEFKKKGLIHSGGTSWTYGKGYEVTYEYRCKKCNTDYSSEML